MIIACLILISGLLAAQIAGGLVVYKKVRNSYDSLADQVNNYFVSTDSKIPSPFSQSMDSIATLFADRNRVALSAAERGAQGAAARDLNRGLEEIATESNPALAIAAGMPKSLRKNPLAQAGLQMLINRILQGELSKGNGDLKASSESGQGSFSI